MGSISLPTILAYGIAVILLLLIITAFKTPARIIAKFVLNAALGLLALIIINSLGNFINFHIPINAYTIFATGILGIPGFVLAVLLINIF